ncbi:MAG: hypothetical protein QOE92_2576 [Chloroflexota bacterium]|nr:hypothetical protein [Chloroflexota bacterium]
MSAERLRPIAGMRVRLRRPHACGTDAFIVASVGADVRLFCIQCGAKIFIERARFAARVSEVLPEPDPATEAPET